MFTSQFDKIAIPKDPGMSYKEGITAQFLFCSDGTGILNPTRSGGWIVFRSCFFPGGMDGPPKILRILKLSCMFFFFKHHPQMEKTSLKVNLKNC